MKYDKETTDKLIKAYQEGQAANNENIVAELAAQFDVPERSIIAKLSSCGVYKRKEYLNKRGEVPIKKEQYIEKIANLMEVNLELLDSLEKANKNVLLLLVKALES
jgi:Zn-dependent peptidase ImmA (M78 family)